ncbi:MAG TPA: aldo/keto reductase, partial [Anaerolineae bacterium]|nr:aldo/keto reductase [Anaerolineae bacterium]
EHLEENLKAVDAVSLLTDNVLDTIEDVLDNQPEA